MHIVDPTKSINKLGPFLWLTTPECTVLRALFLLSLTCGLAESVLKKPSGSAGKGTWMGSTAGLEKLMA